MTNADYDKKAQVSHFTDYITGNIHHGDSILILGFDHSLILHNEELHKIAKLIHDNEPDMLADLEHMMKSRTEEEHLGFMSLVRNVSQTIDFSGIQKKSQQVLNYLPKGTLQRVGAKTKTVWTKNSYAITLGILGLFVL